MRSIFAVAIVATVFASAQWNNKTYSQDQIVAQYQDFEPSWSPDGKRLIFTSTRTGSEQVFIANVDGSDQQQLTFSDHNNTKASWSPDGDWIVFISTRDGNPEIYLMKPDGSTQHNISNTTADEWEIPAWSPDGRRIAFTSDRDGGGDLEIYTMALDGTDIRRLTWNDTDELLDGGAWSPDGRSLAYWAGDGDKNEDIFAIDVDGENQRRLTTQPGMDVSPAYSPDGQWIYYVTRPTKPGEPGNFSIYRMPAGGGERQLISEGGRWNFNPVLSPDGLLLAFDSDRGLNRGLWIAKPDGSGTRQITNN